MIFSTPFPDNNPKRQAIRTLYHADETECVAQLLQGLARTEQQARNIHQDAAQLVEAIRANNENHGGLDAFLHEFTLSSEEGIALMCLAEALLRVPDAATADQLIQDKLSNRDWSSHLGESHSFFVNASTWGLMLTGKLIAFDKSTAQNLGDHLGRLIARSGEPVIRTAIRQAMKILGKQFVLAETIHQALKTAVEKEAKGYCYSYDMLGEAAKTADDAAAYLAAYQSAITVIGQHDQWHNPYQSAGISIKLSALHPRYEVMKNQRIINELFPRLKQLCGLAKSFNIGLTIDAEESERLDPSLTLLQSLCTDPSLADWQGLGFVVQAYQKRAPAVIDWIADLALQTNRTIMIRLVKGAYWDTEIKQAQVEGYAGYPVFTRKSATDLSYLVCAQKLLNNPTAFYPLFATHNAHTVTSILHFAGSRRDYEFQCLHGMGETLYDQVTRHNQVNCRIYAPVGPHKELLAYLVRRLLENGANSSFVNRLVDNQLPIEQIIADPVELIQSLEPKPHPTIPLPLDLYDGRRNARGFNLHDALELDALFQKIAAQYSTGPVRVTPLISGLHIAENNRSMSDVVNPSTGETIGTVVNAVISDIPVAIDSAHAAQGQWDALGATKRADILKVVADHYEANHDELLSLCIQEAGKTLHDAVAELRESVDFLRYYAQQAERTFDRPVTLTGPTGELNQIMRCGRGVFVCISPWNFPLAIFTGQVSAALAAGNAVIAKPAEQTPTIAYRAVQIMHQCGVPEAVLQLLPGDGETIGAALVRHPKINGVTFTGSTVTAKAIQRSLARQTGAIVPFIAETGGINAMLVDSTALPEQVVRDVVRSAFQSAGQRCSALRILYLQEEVADVITDMLTGAVAELKVGNSAEFDTDVGPMIDAQARQQLLEHVQLFKARGNRIIDGPPVEDHLTGFYVSPMIIEIDGIADLEEETFGPILHLCRFPANRIDQVVDDINALGYGLTFGIHSRVQSTIDRITDAIKAGNIYVNRNTIGAVVGVQPFGGEGLSGTGPKAGGPHYLHSFTVERTLSVDTTAAGGNPSLLSLEVR